jgi:hypothetical protein
VGDLADICSGLPLRSYVLGICGGSSGAVRGGTRGSDGFVAVAAMSSVCAWRVRSGGEAERNSMFLAKDARNRTSDGSVRKR